ncbi:hypothetical protein [Nonomuraea sp. CA-141351]|uniref:hypothetical protein n=1 Tax=Nonomuraea sp. CA-141351 TaxID=3239996 RepID=UPI003D902181
MAEHSYPFDTSALNEAQWSRMAGSWQDNGVDARGPWDQALKVLTTGQPFQLLVTSGNAKVAGFHYELDANTVVLFQENKTTASRTDRVVLKLDRETNTVALTVKQGGATAPPIDRSWDALEIPLATFTVRANSDTVVPADLTDVREFVSSGVQMLPAVSGPGARQLTEGQIGYNPTAAKFYARDNAREFELGPPQDLSPYVKKTDANLSYAPRVHSHTFYASPLSFTWQSGLRVDTAQAYARAGVAHFSFSLDRTASGTLPSGTVFASINALPYAGYPLFIAYVFSDNASTLTKAGCVALNPNGEFYTYNTFWGSGENIIVSGSYLIAPGSVTVT